MGRKSKLTDKHKYVAYLLNQDPDFDYSQRKIAELMETSQSSISSSIKEVGLRRQIEALENELSEAKAYIESRGYQSQTLEILPLSPSQKESIQKLADEYSGGPNLAIPNDDDL